MSSVPPAADGKTNSTALVGGVWLVLRRIWSLWIALFFWGFYLALFPLYWLCLRRPSHWGHRVAHGLNIVWGAVLLGVGLMPVRKQFAQPLRKEDGPYVFVANHRSYLDIPVCHVALPRQFRFLAKAELAHLPVFGYMYSRLHVLVNRQDRLSSARAVLKAEALLEQGISLFIFPEGTTQRHEGENLGTFKDGAFLLAVNTQRPIIPVTLVGTDVALPADNRFLPRPMLIQVKVGKPIPTTGLSPADVPQLRERVRAEILRTFTS